MKLTDDAVYARRSRRTPSRLKKPVCASKSPGALLAIKRVDVMALCTGWGVAWPLEYV